MAIVRTAESVHCCEGRPALERGDFVHRYDQTHVDGTNFQPD